MKQKFKIGIIGLGYVGLPLAVAFAKKFPVVGFDLNIERISQLKQNKDVTLEIKDNELKEVSVEDFNNSKNGLVSSNLLSDLEACNFYIVTVPTPVDKNNRPILTPLIKASESVGIT